MKKLSLYTLLSVLCMFMTSCDEDFEDWAEPQSWPQDEAVTIPGFTASATGSIIDLKDVAEDSVQLFTLNNGADAEIENVRVGLSVPGSAEASQAVMFVSDNDGRVAKAELAKFVEDAFGKRPVERAIVGNVYADVMVGGQAMFVNAGEIQISVVPVAPVIRDTYYLVGNICGWDTKAALKFNHSDKDVYEDPVFTLVFNVTDAELGTYWKVITKENPDDDWAGQIGVATDGDTSMSGKLVSENAQAGHIEKPGMYMMTLNMMDYTYEIKEMASEYYLVGAMQGWNANADGKTCILYPNSASEFTYTTKWEGDGNFKFWLGNEFGDWSKAFGTEVDMSREMTGNIKANGGAIAVPEQNMFYTVTIDMTTMTYAWAKCDNQDPKTYGKIGVIGGFNNWAADAEMTQAAPHNWYVQIKLDADTELKLRADGDWADNWGAEDGLDLSKNNYFDSKYNGGNIKVAAGEYTIFFNDITGKMIFVKK